MFVIHYAVGLAVSAVVTHWWPDAWGWNAAGMLLALGLSVLAGSVLHHWTEQKRPGWRQWLFWVAVLMASAGLAMAWAQAMPQDAAAD